MFRDAKTAKLEAWVMGSGSIGAPAIASMSQYADSEATRSVLVSLNRHFYFTHQPMRITKKFLEYVRASKKDRVMQMIATHPECLFAKYGKDQSPFHAALTIGDTDLLESMEPYVYLVPEAVETTLEQICQLLDAIDAFVPYDFRHVVNVISNARYENDTIDPDSKLELEKFKKDFKTKSASGGFDFDLQNLLSFIRTGIKKSRESRLNNAPWRWTSHFKFFKSTVFLDLLHCMPVSDLQMYCQGMDDILICKNKFSRILSADLLSDQLYARAFDFATERRLVPMQVAREAKIHYLKQLRDRLTLSLDYADLQGRQAHALLGYVLRGEATQAVALIATNPTLLFAKSTNKTVMQKEYVDVTPFEAMLGAGDTSLLEEVEPYLSKLPNGYQLAAELFAKQFPEGVDVYVPINNGAQVRRVFRRPVPVDAENAIEQCTARSSLLDAFLDVDNWNQQFSNRSNRSTGLHFNLLYLSEFVTTAYVILERNDFGSESEYYKLSCAKMIENILQHVSACDAQAICQDAPFRIHGTLLKRSINVTADLPGENFYTRLRTGYDSHLASAIISAIGNYGFIQGNYTDSGADDDNLKGDYCRTRLEAFYENKIKKLTDFQARLSVVRKHSM